VDTKVQKKKNIKIRVAIGVSFFLGLNILLIISLMLNYIISINDTIGQEAISVAKLVSNEYRISNKEYTDLQKMEYTTLINSKENKSFQENMMQYFNNFHFFNLKKIYILGIIKDQEQVKYKITEEDLAIYEAQVGEDIYGFYYLEALDDVFNRKEPTDSYYYLDRDKYVYINKELKEKLNSKNETYIINKKNDSYITGYYPIYSTEGEHIGDVAVEIYRDRVLGMSSTLRLHLVFAIILLLITQILIIVVYRTFRVSIKERDSHKGLPFHDSLTGLLNRSGFESNLRESIIEAIKKDCEVALLIVDIDNFKKFNDLYGYIQGDLILIQVANIIQAEILNYPEAKIGRIGGDEYYIFINDTNKEEVSKTANNIVQKIRDLNIPNKSNSNNILTVSIGGTCKAPTKQYYKYLAYIADINLYKIKSKDKDGYSITKR